MFILLSKKSGRIFNSFRDVRTRDVAIEKFFTVARLQREGVGGSLARLTVTSF